MERLIDNVEKVERKEGKLHRKGEAWKTNQRLVKYGLFAERISDERQDRREVAEVEKLMRMNIIWREKE